MTGSEAAIRERLSEFTELLEEAFGQGYEGDNARALEAMRRVKRRLTELLGEGDSQRGELKALGAERRLLEQRLRTLGDVARDVGSWGQRIHGAAGRLLNGPGPVDARDVTLRAARAMLDSAEARAGARQEVAEARRLSARATDLQERSPARRAQAERRLRLARERARQLGEIEQQLERDLEQAEYLRYEASSAEQRYYKGLSEVIREWISRHGRDRALDLVVSLVDAGAPSGLIDEHFPPEPEPEPQWQESGGDYYEDQGYGGWDRGY
ncbi:hypothetical protein ACI796_02250 [Geodermatophilus sp. SYSU D00525]